MAVGKNKRISKGKKGGKKKVADPYLRKEWFDLKAPALFNKRKFGKTIVTKTTGTKIATEMLKGRVASISLADLQDNPDLAFRQMKLCIEETQGKECLTNFHGMDMTKDSLGWLVRKWQTLIEAHVEVKTQDGYMLRIFCIGFTKKRDNQIKKTCYAQTSQIKLIRKKMMEIMTKEASQNDLKTLVQKFITEEIGKSIVKQTATIFPLKDVSIRKVKVLKKPKFDISKLMEIHLDTNQPAAAKQKESKETENTLTQEIKTATQ